MPRVLRLSLALVASLSLHSLLFVAAPVHGGTVQGTVTFHGAVPTLPTLDMGADPQCADLHEGDVTSAVLVLGEPSGGGRTLGNVLVQITGAVPAPAAQSAQSAADGTVVIDQRGCLYQPRVVGVRVGQTLEVRNSDGIMHNVHFVPDANDEKNLAMPPFLDKIEIEFATPEPAFPVKCDMHPWMKAWVAVLEHPYFAVTEADGAFAIDGLPAGTYTAVAWHEKLGTRDAEFTVTEDGMATVDFSMSR